MRFRRASDPKAPQWPPNSGTALNRGSVAVSSEGRTTTASHPLGILHFFFLGGRFLSSEEESGDGADDAPPMVDFPFVCLWTDARRSPEQPRCA